MPKSSAGTAETGQQNPGHGNHNNDELHAALREKVRQANADSRTEAELRGTLR